MLFSVLYVFSGDKDVRLALSHRLAELTAIVFSQSCTLERALGVDGYDVVGHVCDGCKYTIGDQTPKHV